MSCLLQVDRQAGKDDLIQACADLNQVANRCRMTSDAPKEPTPDLIQPKVSSGRFLQL